MTKQEVGVGLPIECFLSRMHADDLPHVAKAIHNTMITGEPFQSEYRVCRPDKSVVELLAMGICFKDRPGKVSALELWLLAHDAAISEGNTAAAERIIDAMAVPGGIEPQMAAIMQTASRY